MATKQIRRKLMTLEAIQFVDDPAVIEELREFMGLEELEVAWDRGAPQLIIEEPEGFSRLDQFSYVIRTEHGRFRGMPADVFDANFEEVELPPAPKMTKAEEKAAAKAAAERAAAEAAEKAAEEKAAAEAAEKAAAEKAAAEAAVNVTTETVDLVPGAEIAPTVTSEGDGNGA